MSKSMDVQEYLKNRLEHCADYRLTDLDKQVLNNGGIEGYIFKKLTAKKFRKWAIAERVQEKIKEQIAFCVAHQKPIRLNLSYGGFKLWRMPTAPKVDWSEFFAIAYFAEYMGQIAAAYTHGAQLDFTSADIAVTSFNNVPRADVDAYHESMRKLIEQFAKYLPKNIVFSQSRFRDLFKDEAEFIAEAEKVRGETDEEFMRGAVQNVQIKGARDLSSLSAKELEDYRRHAAECIEYMYGIPKIDKRDRANGIALLATKLQLDGPSIMTGTTRRSTAKFWAGIGVLARDGDTFAEYVITLKQWEAIKSQPHETIESNLIPLKNFKEILVYPEKFNFSSR